MSHKRCGGTYYEITFAATLDVGQMAACGHDPVDAVVVCLAPRLKVASLKDVASAGAEHNVLSGTESQYSGSYDGAEEETPIGYGVSGGARA